MAESENTTADQLVNTSTAEYNLSSGAYNSNNNIFNTFSLRKKYNYDGRGVMVASEPVELLVWVQIPAAILNRGEI